MNMNDTPIIFTITQATRAVFTDLYFKDTFLFFIQSGEKHVQAPQQEPLVGKAGDLIIFARGSMVTMENRPVVNDDYRAIAVGYSQEAVDRVFTGQVARGGAGVPRVQVLSNQKDDFSTVLQLTRDTLADHNIPDAIKQHRLREPLIWLKSVGVDLPTGKEDNPIHQLRQLIETDLSFPWSSVEVASRLNMSEATLRRRLASSGQGFAKILMHTRLERGLTLLQTTDLQIAQIALECGFKTPSHFSDSFRKRFQLRPKEIRQVADPLPENK